MRCNKKRFRSARRDWVRRNNSNEKFVGNAIQISHSMWAKYAGLPVKVMLVTGDPHGYQVWKYASVR
jgi:hypothetical protein